MKNIIITIAHILSISLYMGCASWQKKNTLQKRINEDVAEAKLTIRKAFVFSANEQYDSLKVFMPSIDFENAVDGDLKINFRLFRQIVALDGIPDTSMFKPVEEPNENTTYLTFKFVPISKDSLLIDSAKFTFVSPLGARQIWTYEFFKNRKSLNNLQTINTQ